jgi:hypothetical protein
MKLHEWQDTSDTAQYARECRQSWAQHRLLEVTAAEIQWQDHVDAFTGKRASSDPEKIRAGLIASGALLPIANRPTLRQDYAALRAIAFPELAWDPRDLMVQVDGVLEQAEQKLRMRAA